MNGKTNEKVIVKNYEFDEPLIHKIDSIIDNCIRDCHDKYFHTIDDKCVYDIKLTNIGNNEIFILTISYKNMSLYEMNEKFKSAQENGFNIIQIKNFKKKLIVFFLN